MILLLKVAYRNVFRNFRRSLLTFLAISLGIALSILFIGFSIGAEQQSIRLSVDTRAGHVKIYGKGYIDEDLTVSLDYTIENYPEMMDRLGSIPGVEASAERILFPASVTDGIDELKLTGAGINIENEHKVFQLKNKLLKGGFINPDDERILLTEEIANLFSLDVGDIITVMARTKYNAINAIDLEIAGILNIGNPEVDNQCFFVPIKFAQEFLDMQNAVTEISIVGASMESADLLAENIRNTLNGGNYDIVTWEYIARDLIRLYKIRAKARILVISILFMMAAASIMNTMLMSIFERTREVGTIMAMGLRKGKIVLLFIFEGMFLGIFGSLVGCLLGGGFTYYFKVHGISVASMYEDGIGNFPIGKYIYTEITFEYVAAIFLLGVCIAIASAAYPAFRGAKLQPAEALRYV